MQSIKQSVQGFVVAGVETHRVTAQTQLVYATFHGSEHDSITALTHAIDALKEVHDVDVTFLDNMATFETGLYRYTLIITPVGQFESVSHVYSLLDHLRAHGLAGNWPAGGKAPKSDVPAEQSEV